MGGQSHIIVLSGVENILQNPSFIHDKETQEIRFDGKNIFFTGSTPFTCENNHLKILPKFFQDS